MNNDNLTLTIASGHSRKEDRWRNTQVTWGQLVKRLAKTTYTDETEAEYAAMTRDERQDQKDIGGFVGGEMINGIASRKKENVRTRQILSLDMDYGSPGTQEDFELFYGWECVVHTTHSHTRENPRYRLFIPLSKPVPPAEYEAVARMVAQQFGLEKFDDSTFEVNRLMFWPSTCKDGEFIYWRSEGKVIDPDEFLKKFYTDQGLDWHDQANWPISEKAKKIRHSSATRQQSPYKKKGLIGAFIRAYDIPSAIDKFLPDVYVPNERDPRRYTYVKGSTSNGLYLYGDEGNEDNPPWCFAFSHHGSDPAYNTLCNAFDLVRIHLYGDRDDPNGNSTEQSAEALRQMISTDDAVRRELVALTEENADSVFVSEEGEATLRRSTDDFTEQGNAIRLKDTYNKWMRFNKSMGWCIWNGEIWKTDAEHLATIFVMRQADDMLKEAKMQMQLAPHPTKGTKKDDWPEEYKLAAKRLDWANKSRNTVNQTHTLNSAKGLMNLDDLNTFDHDPWMLNTPRGIIDLRSGETREHQAEEMCTKLTSVSPDPTVPHPMWDAFLERITEGDKSLQQYLQDVAGMALVGKVYEEGVVICYGPGGNGKSTLFEIWKSVMGDYALTVRNELVMGSKNGNEVAGQEQLRGLRLVIASELEEGQTMSNSMMKRITSRDDISCDVKFHAPITFTPTHTLLLHTNHLPKLKSVDDGTRRRLAIVPILNKIRHEEKVTDFADKLLESEASGVLWWMIQGAMRFYRNDMKVEKPYKVRKMSEEYVDSEDSLRVFLEECCKQDPDASVQSSALFRAYTGWLKENSQSTCLTIRTFPRAMRERGYETSDRSGSARILGLAVQEDTPSI